MWISLRSEPVSLCQIYLNKELAYDCLSELGEVGIIQVKDTDDYDNNRINEEFTGEIERCFAMEKILNEVIDMMKIENVYVEPCQKLPETPNVSELPDLEAAVQEIRSKLDWLKKLLDELKKQHLEKFEHELVLQYLRVVLGEENEDGGYDFYPKDEINKYATLEVAAGIIPTNTCSTCERILWRISRGNIVFRHQTIMDQPTFLPTNFLSKTEVFCMLFQGYDWFKTISIPLINGFNGRFFEIPKIAKDRMKLYTETKNIRKELEEIIGRSNTQYHSELDALRRDLCPLLVKVKKMKLIFVNLNKLLPAGLNSYIVECWVPTELIPDVTLTVTTISDEKNIPAIVRIIPTVAVPPTVIITNRFTIAFQEITDAYGVPAYRELNPAAFAIITFPFLFSVMFGDVGHGTVLLALSILMICNERKLKTHAQKNEILQFIFGGRYIILLLGMFSVYAGFIYNSVFSKCVNIFGSSWRTNYNTSTMGTSHIMQLNPALNDYAGYPYLFGKDPIWNVGADLNMPVDNSFKMKISIIFGVLHMILGLFLGLCNHIYFRNYLSIIFDFIPQLVFLSSLFFYLVILIFHKWSTYGADKKESHGAGCAPLLLIVFINIFLMHDSPKTKKGCLQYMYTGEKIVERTLLLIALCSVPVMLLGKPLYILYKRKKRNTQVMNTLDLIEHGSPDYLIFEKSLTDIVIEQVIMTIESVLGSVSHTASYLRLWALSLAHDQLADILWHMVLAQGFKVKSYFGGLFLVFCFAAWAGFTFCILVLMEGLSAFLHTLRLHWVEFQSRFYAGNGYKYEPFSFHKLFVKERLILD